MQLEDINIEELKKDYKIYTCPVCGSIIVVKKHLDPLLSRDIKIWIIEPEICLGTKECYIQILNFAINVDLFQQTYIKKQKLKEIF